jgi:hypothetical protein
MKLKIILTVITIGFFLIPLTGLTQTITATRLSDGSSATYNCDGIDDHIQINQALEYVKTNGGIVSLSADTFVIDSALYFAGNHTTLQGIGMDQTTIKLVDNAGWSYYYQDGTPEWIRHETGPMILNKKEANHNLSVKNLKIDGNKYNQSIFNPITNETIQNTPDSHVFDGQGHYVAIDFRKQPGSTESVSDILFSHVFIYENSDDGLVVNNGTNITVEFCKGVRGGHSIVYFLDPINLVVKNCDLMVTSNSGIRWYDGNHIVIQNNHIYGEPEKTGNSNFCIQMTSGQSATITDDLIIEGNKLEFSAGAGIALDAKESSGAKDFIIRNNTIFQCGNSGTTENMREAGGINLKNITNTLIENNTIVNCIGGGIRLGGNVGFNTEWTYETGLTAIIKNNIITNTIEGGNSTASGYGIDIASGNSAICTFNNVWGNDEGNYFGCIPDVGSISVDPKFKSVVLGTIFNNTNDTTADFHLKSENGRWNSNLSIWETDPESSLCINGGNPNDDYSNEPSVNGNRLNLGAYGNTVYASKGSKAPPVANAGADQYIRDDNNDGIVFVTLNGSLSTDDGAIQSYSWQRNGAEILNSVSGNIPFVLGQVEVTLTVIDNDGISSTDKTNIKILPFGSNIDPIANAGSDITVTDKDNNNFETVFLDASESSDVDAILTNYSWSEDGLEIATGINPEIDVNVGIHIITLTVTDNEGGTNTDTVQVMVRPKANYALEFSNDFNDEVVITNNLTFHQTFTIEMWIKQTSTINDTALLWLGGDGKRVMLKTSVSLPSWDETTSNTAANGLTQNNWHHLAYIVENNILTHIYIDGISSSINNTTTIQTPTDINIGAFYGTTDSFESNFVGIMDELRYWNTARTVGEINGNKDHELVGDEVGLEAYWNFNDGSGKRLSDLSGIADGTLFNMEDIDWVTETPFSNTANIDDINNDLFSMSIFPNPADLKATISLNLPKSQQIQLSLFNINGKKIIEILDHDVNAGETNIQLNISNLSSGIYFCILKTNNKVFSKKVIISKK